MLKLSLSVFPEYLEDQQDQDIDGLDVQYNIEVTVDKTPQQHEIHPLPQHSDHNTTDSAESLSFPYASSPFESLHEVNITDDSQQHASQSSLHTDHKTAESEKSTSDSFVAANVHEIEDRNSQQHANTRHPLYQKNSSTAATKKSSYLSKHPHNAPDNFTKQTILRINTDENNSSISSVSLDLDNATDGSIEQNNTISAPVWSAFSLTEYLSQILGSGHEFIVEEFTKLQQSIKSLWGVQNDAYNTEVAIVSPVISTVASPQNNIAPSAHTSHKRRIKRVKRGMPLRSEFPPHRHGTKRAGRDVSVDISFLSPLHRTKRDASSEIKMPYHRIRRVKRAESSGPDIMHLPNPYLDSVTSDQKLHAQVKKHEDEKASHPLEQDTARGPVLRGLRSYTDEGKKLLTERESAPTITGTRSRQPLVRVKEDAKKKKTKKVKATKGKKPKSKSLTEQTLEALHSIEDTKSSAPDASKPPAKVRKTKSATKVKRTKTPVEKTAVTDTPKKTKQKKKETIVKKTVHKRGKKGKSQKGPSEKEIKVNEPRQQTKKSKKESPRKAKATNLKKPKEKNVKKKKAATKTEVKKLEKKLKKLDKEESESTKKGKKKLGKRKSGSSKKEKKLKSTNREEKKLKKKKSDSVKKKKIPKKKKSGSAKKEKKKPKKKKSESGKKEKKKVGKKKSHSEEKKKAIAHKERRKHDKKKKGKKGNKTIIVKPSFKKEKKKKKKSESTNKELKKLEKKLKILEKEKSKAEKKKAKAHKKKEKRLEKTNRNLEQKLKKLEKKKLKPTKNKDTSALKKKVEKLEKLEKKMSGKQKAIAKQKLKKLEKKVHKSGKAKKDKNASALQKKIKKLEKQPGNKNKSVKAIGNLKEKVYTKALHSLLKEDKKTEKAQELEIATLKQKLIDQKHDLRKQEQLKQLAEKKRREEAKKLNAQKNHQVHQLEKMKEKIEAADAKLKEEAKQLASAKQKTLPAKTVMSTTGDTQAKMGETQTEVTKVESKTDERKTETVPKVESKTVVPKVESTVHLSPDTAKHLQRVKKPDKQKEAWKQTKGQIHTWLDKVGSTKQQKATSDQGYSHTLKRGTKQKPAAKDSTAIKTKSGSEPSDEVKTLAENRVAGFQVYKAIEQPIITVQRDPTRKHELTIHIEGLRVDERNIESGVMNISSESGQGGVLLVNSDSNKNLSTFEITVIVLVICVIILVLAINFAYCGNCSFCWNCFKKSKNRRAQIDRHAKSPKKSSKGKPKPIESLHTQSEGKEYDNYYDDKSHYRPYDRSQYDQNQYDQNQYDQNQYDQNQYDQNQ